MLMNYQESSRHLMEVLLRRRVIGPLMNQLLDNLRVQNNWCHYFLNDPASLNSLITKKDWPENELHGQLNQCVAITGRLSASQPNQQNVEKDVKEIFITRY